MTVSEQQISIANLSFNAAQPTVIAANQLTSWVIWQFPRRKGNHLCGAVHSPQKDFGWLPALIEKDGANLHIFAHLTDTFSTPEVAADWLATLDE